MRKNVLTFDNTYSIIRIDYGPSACCESVNKYVG